MQTRPYPYERLAKLTRQQLALRAAVRELWSDAAVLDAERVLVALLGAKVRVEPGSVEIYPAELIAARLGHAGAGARIALVLECAQAPLPAPWLLELAASDAQRVVDRALGGDGSETTPSVPWPLDELSRGALAYVAARVLAALGGRLTLRDLVDLPLTDALFPSGAAALWPVALWLGETRVPLRLYVPERVCFEPGAGDLHQRSVQRDLHALPLTLIASAGSLRITMSIVRTLQPGDTLMLDDTQLTHAHGAVRGRLTARVPGSGDSFTCVVDAHGLTIEALTRIQEPRTSVAGRVMSPFPNTPARADAAAEEAAAGDFALDAPIELQVELARFSLTLAELQRLRPGDVLATGRRIGEHVRLCVSGQVFAEGELVDIEGELGVKITSFNAPAAGPREP